MKYAWDLDGTLVQTREANYEAYCSLGISPPDDFHLIPWEIWCPRDIHDQKGRVIDRFIQQYAKPTFLLSLFNIHGGDILTNASVPVVRSLRERFPELGTATIHCPMSPTQKIRWLQKHECTGIYFDDSQETVQRVIEETSWNAVHVSF